MKPHILIICHLEPYKCKYFLVPTEYVHDNNIMHLFADRIAEGNNDNTLYCMCKKQLEQFEITDLTLLSTVILYATVIVGSDTERNYRS